jgi:HEAT repeat protein
MFEERYRGRSLAGWLELLCAHRAERRKEAATALMAIGLPAVPGLLRIVKEGRPPDRCRAIRVLAHIGPAAKPAVPLLLEARKDLDRRVRYEVQEALMMIDPGAAGLFLGLWLRLRRMFRKKPRPAPAPAKKS